jgi:integrase
MRAKLTQAFVEKAVADAGAERTVFWDQDRPGFGLVVTGKGAKSFVAQFRVSGQSRRLNLDGDFLRYEAVHDPKGRILPPRAGAYTLGDAKREHAAVMGAVGRGRDPLAELRAAKAAAKGSLETVAEAYLAARETRGLRSVYEKRGVFRRYIYPRFGGRAISSIKRSEIIRLLDKIEAENGPVAAEHTLALLRRLFNWYATRPDGEDFLSPIVRGMSRIKPEERARDRVLDDAELKAVWRAAEGAGTPYAHMLRFVLLTATRLREASNMTRGELSADGTEWLIPAARHKSKREFLLPLSVRAQAVLAAVPVIGRRGWMFTTGGDTPISGFSKFKRRFDDLVLAELCKANPAAKRLPRWTPHDLRRSARSLMSRAGVNPDHAERALGHKIPGIRGVYDRHAFVDEKRHAFEALAMQIERILNPTDNVVTLRAK